MPAPTSTKRIPTRPVPKRAVTRPILTQPRRTRLAPPPRKFVPRGFDPGDTKAIAKLFDTLLGRPLAGPEQIERFLEDSSELSSAIEAEMARRYIAMTRKTADAKAKKRYLAFEADVMPLYKTLLDRLDRKLLSAPALAALDRSRYEVFLRAKRTLVEIFREENTGLEAREAEIRARYSSLMGAMTVQLDGKEMTLQQVAAFLEANDRSVREKAWRASAERRKQDRAAISKIFEELLALRGRIARNAGLPDYRAFRFKELCRFDYTPEDCVRFHTAVEEKVLPALATLDAQRRERLGLERLRPWDLDVDVNDAPPIRPFTTESELMDIDRRLFAAVDPRFAREFDALRRKEMLDLMSRKGKAPGGYQYSIEDIRLPFIFANAVGRHDDVQTLLHEGGHAFHSLLCRDEPLLAYRQSPLEFAEVASMGMELMGLEHLERVYPKELAQVARRGHLETVLRLFPWIASIDAFQHWLYLHEGHTRAERKAAWLRIRGRFSPTVDYSGLQDHLAHAWQAQGHLFGSPFYYIEYGIAQIGALQVWRNARKDQVRAVERYRAALSLGGSRPLPELFAAAELRFDMGSELLGELVDEVLAALAV